MVADPRPASPRGGWPGRPRRRGDADTAADDALVVQDGLVPACGVGSGVFTFIGASLLALDDAPGSAVAGVLALLTALGMAVCWWQLARHPLGALGRRAPLVGLLFGLALCANPLVYMVATHITYPPVGIVLSIVAVGALLPGRFGALVVVAVATAGWIACAVAFGIPVPATEFASAVVKTVALALLLYLAWSRTRRRLHAANRLVGQMAVTDALTGLMNRRGFGMAGEQALRRTAARSTVVSVLYLDVDGLKEINDRLGHEAGDDLLRRVGRALQGSVRDWDVTARLGGDEFAAILEDCTPGELEAVARRLAEALDGASARASIGRANSDPGAGPADFPALVAAADAAMYARKHSSRADRTGTSDPVTTGPAAPMTSAVAAEAATADHPTAAPMRAVRSRPEPTAGRPVAGEPV